MSLCLLAVSLCEQRKAYIYNNGTGPKGYSINNLECFAIFPIKDVRKGDDLIFTGRAFHIMLAR